MAFGPDHFNLTVKAGSVFCFQGQDTDALLGGPESEPYLWMLGYKIDGTSLTQNGNVLVGDIGLFVNQGGHRNLTNGIVSRQSVRIRPEVGQWTTDVRPIPISIEERQVTQIPATVGMVAILMEENLTPGQRSQRRVSSRHKSAEVNGAECPTRHETGGNGGRCSRRGA